jgi:hypothetical protein
MAAGHRAFGAARSVLDSCEHDGILAASGPQQPPKPQLAAVYPRFLTAANNRLARNVAFVSNLMESGAEFVAADMPAVNRLTVHILAAVAEEEARMISARTRAALAAAKARGVRLGNPRLLARDAELSAKGNAVQAANAWRRASSVLPYIEGARRAGARTLAEIAEALMARGVPAPRGGDRWSPAQVRRTLLIGSTSGGG